MSDSELEAAIESALEGVPTQLPAAFASRGNKSNVLSLIHSVSPLTDEDVKAAQDHVASGRSLGVSTPNLKQIRSRHHRLAQLLAIGTPDIQAATMCGFVANRVAHLRRDPAFQELLTYYSEGVEAQFQDTVAMMADLNTDMLEELGRRLDENPEQFTVPQLLEAIRTLADRAGYAPVTKSVSVNASVDLGARLAAARQRVVNG
jgi:hypothetical protein